MLFDQIFLRGGICDLIKFLLNPSLRMNECMMVQTLYFCNIISLLLLCYLLILSLPQVFEQSLFLFLKKVGVCENAALECAASASALSSRRMWRPLT